MEICCEAMFIALFGIYVIEIKRTKKEKIVLYSADEVPRSDDVAITKYVDSKERTVLQIE